MSELVIKSAQDAEDLAWGACFYGIGGGGPVQAGLDLLQKALARHGEVRCMDPVEFPDDAYVVTVSFMGNRAPLTPEQEAQKKRLGLEHIKYENNLEEALLFLEQKTGKRIRGIVPSELGGANAPGPLSVALNLGLTVLNGDYTGKAKPEAGQGAPCMLGYDMAPLATVDKWGNRTMLYTSVSNGLSERIGKSLAVAAFGNTGMAYFLLPGSVMKKAIFPGTLTECFDLGRAMREAGEQGRNVVEAILHQTQGHRVFEGKVVHKEWDVPGGYYTGVHLLEGTGDFLGHTFRIWFKNENHITWLDEKPFITSPDRVGQVRTATGTPIMTQEIQVGDALTFIAQPSRERHLRSDLLHFMEPRHYGFDMDYVPMASLLTRQ